jgi:hypothetical protein
VPQAEQNKGRALAPGVCFSGFLLNDRPFSAASSVVPKAAVKSIGLYGILPVGIEWISCFAQG